VNAGVAVVAGASGLIGTATIEELRAHDWEVLALSRRPPEVAAERPFRHLPVDLTDPAATGRVLRGLDGVTHLVYAAAYEKPALVAGWSDPGQMAINRRMLDNVLGPLASGGGLEHVTLMQGTKAYGVHLHPIPVPARERAPRDPHPNFYWYQEDLLRELADRIGFGWTILRPVQVVGPAYGVAYSTPPVIGAFAALCAKLGMPFGFPGGVVNPVKQAVDVRVVAQAIRWAAHAPAARGEHFNLTNGEVFSWQQLWPSFAEVLGVEAAEPLPLGLGAELPRHADAWDRIVERHGLRRLSLRQLLGQSHLYADYTFGYGSTSPPPPALVSTIKVKQAGFTVVQDTEDTFRHALQTLVARKVLPDLVGRRR
jgi:nucleoside-diphosphate-sugar epimerase